MATEMIEGSLLHAMAMFNGGGFSSNARSIKAGIVKVNDVVQVSNDTMLEDGDVVKIGARQRFTFNSNYKGQQ